MSFSTTGNDVNTGESLSQSLQNDRLIKIFVGTSTTPICVQQKLLENTSDFFTKALRNEHLGEEQESGIIRFPDDHIEAWDVLLEVMFRQKKPIERLLSNAKLAMRCWALGDRLDMPAFQNQAMASLITKIEMSARTPPMDFIKEAVKTSPPGSPMRTLMAEMVVLKLRKEDMSTDELDIFDGYGFTRELMQEQMKSDDESDYERGLDDEGRVEYDFSFEPYAVGEGIPGVEKVCQNCS